MIIIIDNHDSVDGADNVVDVAAIAVATSDDDDSDDDGGQWHSLDILGGGVKFSDKKGVSKRAHLSGHTLDTSTNVYHCLKGYLEL